MNTLRKIHTGLGLALVTALALVAGSVAADENTGEAALDLQPGLRCTMSSESSSTGRQWAMIYVTRDPRVCKRVRFGGDAPIDWPSCHQRGRSELGCEIITE